MIQRTISFRTLDERTEPAQYVDATLRTIGRFAAVFIDGQMVTRGYITDGAESIEWVNPLDYPCGRATYDHAIEALKNAVLMDLKNS